MRESYITINHLTMAKLTSDHWNQRRELTSDTCLVSLGAGLAGEKLGCFIKLVDKHGEYCRTVTTINNIRDSHGLLKLIVIINGTCLLVTTPSSIS